MEMKSHQKVPLSQAVANTQPSQAAPRQPDCQAGRRPDSLQVLLLHEARWPAQPLSCQTSTDRLRICSHQRGWPLPGRAIEAACARPASRTDAVGSRRARIRARTPQRAVAGNPATGDTLNQRTAPPRVCCTVKLRPASTWCSPRLGT
jgi:hypothetical protein